MHKTPLSVRWRTFLSIYGSLRDFGTNPIAAAWGAYWCERLAEAEARYGEVDFG